MNLGVAVGRAWRRHIFLHVDVVTLSHNLTVNIDR